MSGSPVRVATSDRPASGQVATKPPAQNGVAPNSGKSSGTPSFSTRGPARPLAVPSIVHDVLQSPGQPLDPATRAWMEPRLGHDFRKVRVHTDERAHQSARSVSAVAYAAGHDIVFRRGTYAPNTSNGKKLLAHELAHVGQAGSNPDASPTSVAPESISGPFEREAETSSRRIEDAAPSQPAVQPSSLASPLVLRAGDDNQSETFESKKSRFDAKAAEDDDASWGDAAVILNGFSDDDIWAIVNDLTIDQVQKLRTAATIAMPGWSDRVTAPIDRLATGSNPVPTPVPVPAQTPTQIPAPTPTTVTADPSAEIPIADMTDVDKLVSAFHRANINQAFHDKILSMFTPKALVIAILSFMAVFIASQFTPVGWAADIGIALTGVFIGGALFSATEHLAAFVDARNATTPEQLDQAGAEFAAAAAELEADAIILLLTHGLGGAAEGGVPFDGPPPDGLVLATGPNNLVVAVAAETIPVEVAAGLGIKGAAGATSLMSQGGSGAGGPPTPTRAQQASDLVSSLRGAGKPVRVNLAGVGEEIDAINVNNLKDQQVKGIPNLIQGNVEEVGDLFDAGSVDKIISNNVVRGQVDWVATAQGSFQILKSGGKVSIAPYIGDLDAQSNEIVAAFEDAGFTNVRRTNLGLPVTPDNPGVVVEADRP